MKKNVIMIVNPVSGGMDKSELIHQAANFAAKENLNYVLYETCADNDDAKIKGLYKKFKPDRVIVAGGDGTVKLVAEALESEDFILGILPAGSSNGLATDLGLPKSIEENLRIAFQNDFLEMDMIVVNGKKSLHLSVAGF